MRDRNPSPRRSATGEGAQARCLYSLILKRPRRFQAITRSSPEKPDSSAFGRQKPSYKRRIPPDIIALRQVGGIAQKQRQSLFAGYFRLNDTSQTRPQGPAFIDQAPHDFALRSPTAAGVGVRVRR